MINWIEWGVCVTPYDQGGTPVSTKFRKLLALVLTLCTLATLTVPVVSAAPEYGDTVEIGQILRGNLNISGLVEITELGGRQYLGVPIKGGRFYVYALSDFLEGKPNAKGNYIYAEVESDIGIPRGIAVDSKGNFYVTGDSGSVFWYNISTGKSGQISTGSSGLTTVAVDENDNVYAVGKSGGGAVYRIDSKTMISKKLYSSADFTTAQGVVCGGGKVFMQGPLNNTVGEGSEVRMLSSAGQVLSTYRLPATGGSYYLSCIDGVVFVGVHSGTTADGLVALDTAGDKLTRMDLGNQNTILGLVTDPYQGKAYMCLANDGTYEYDVAARKLSRKVSNTCNRPLRARNYVRNGSSMLLLSVGPSSVTTIKGPADNTVNLGGLLEGAFSTFTARSMAPGVPGTGVAVYVGAYLSSAVGSYSPGAKEPINASAFSNGHAQTDNMIVYKDKIYAGVYSGGYLIEYDPKTGQVRELIPGLKEDYGQLRIHGLAAGDNKIFFSTIPEDQALGGCIGWYDLAKNTWYCERNVVKDQAVITLAYDEDKDILYGGTTIRGGTNSTPTADQAVLMAYDVNAKKVLATTTVGSLTGDKPRYISGIARDPNTGKFWGLVSQTVFSFAYNNGKLTVTEEWEAATVPGSPYPDSASKSWFPRPIVFDRYGDMYMGFNETQYGIMRFILGENGKIARAECAVENTTRIYTIGADGNLYYYTDRLYMLSLEGSDEEIVTPVDMAIDAILEIDEVTADSGPSIQKARAAYDALTPEQQKEVFNAQVLFDAEKAFAALISQEQLPDDGETPDTDTGSVPGTQTPPNTGTGSDTEPGPDTDTVPIPDYGSSGDIDTTIIMVQVQINAIGIVTADSGPVIRDARQSYDALTPEQQAKVNNAQTLFDAEKAFEALAATTPDDEPPAQAQPDNTVTIVIIAVVAAALIAAAVITTVLLKKKKAPVGADAAAEETPTVEDILNR